MKTFYIHTMGCRSNQFEGAIIEENLLSNGLEKTEQIENANYFILNSCSVTHKSDNEALYLLRNAKHKNPNIITVLTGCIAQIEKENLLKFDYIDLIIGNNEKLNLSKFLKEPSKVIVNDIVKQSEFNHAELKNLSKTRASVKIQDGCDNRCSYCIIWKARGKSRSANKDFIINQINNFATQGFKEVMLTGIHIGQWGKDINSNLLNLLINIEQETDIARFRLGSLNPTEINDELLDFLANSKKFCPHFHLSLQSANDKTLKSMNRFYKTDFYLSQIKQINNMFDLPFIGSDIIAGFAGETEDDFEITKNNLKNSGLTQIHTFPYSIRKGTIGEGMQHQLSDEIKKKRANIIKQISKEKYEEFIKKNIGKIHEVLIQKHPNPKNGNFKGLTRNYLNIEIPNPNNLDLYNSLQQVKIISQKNTVLYGEIIVR